MASPTRISAPPLGAQHTQPASSGKQKRPCDCAAQHSVAGSKGHQNDTMTPATTPSLLPQVHARTESIWTQWTAQSCSAWHRSTEGRQTHATVPDYTPLPDTPPQACAACQTFWCFLPTAGPECTAVFTHRPLGPKCTICTLTLHCPPHNETDKTPRNRSCSSPTKPLSSTHIAWRCQPVHPTRRPNSSAGKGPHSCPECHKRAANGTPTPQPQLRKKGLPPNTATRWFDCPPALQLQELQAGPACAGCCLPWLAANGIAPKAQSTTVYCHCGPICIGTNTA
jgi:hypothetical protein